MEAALSCMEGRIRYEDCYAQGKKFTLEAIAPKYEKFFNDVINLYENEGWYHVSKETIKRIKHFYQQ